MKTVIILLLVFGSFVLSLYKRFKRTLAEAGDNADADGQYYESTDEAEEASETASAPYFSYEYDAPKQKAPAWDVKPEPVAAVKAQVTEVSQTKDSVFDLRQAVVYQTVLNNPYINEIN